MTALSSKVPGNLAWYHNGDCIRKRKAGERTIHTTCAASKGKDMISTTRRETATAQPSLPLIKS